MDTSSQREWDLRNPNHDDTNTRADNTLVTPRRRRSLIINEWMLRNRWFTIAILCFVNLINYMDRYTLAGVLIKIQNDLKIGDDQAGLIQTVFIISYMIFAPIFGYLGDRYSRRSIIIGGVIIWSTTTFFGSFVSSFEWFLVFRGLVGIGEASYSTIAPTIISDLYVQQKRSIMLAIFYFAIPVGCGFGYILGSGMESLTNDWRWALRVTPFLGIIAVALLLFIKDPIRGAIEGSTHMETSSYCEDIKRLSKKRSFVLSTAGFTCVAFVTGALSWWAPKFIYVGLRMQPYNVNLTQSRISNIFGIITMFAGTLGVPLGTYISQKWRRNFESCDSHICAMGLFISAPLIYASLIWSRNNEALCFCAIFAAQLALNVCWPLNADILLYVVEPERRSSAEALQILTSHAFGDASSPYLVGLISVTIAKYMRNLNSEAKYSRFYSTDIEEDDLKTEFKSLQYALFLTCFVELIGGIFFLITSLFIVADKNAVIDHIATTNTRQENSRRAIRRTPEQQRLPSAVHS